MHGGNVLQVQTGRGCAGIVALAIVFLQAPGDTASAQTADYFETPWVVAPLPSNSTNLSTTPSQNSSAPAQSARSSLYAQSLATSSSNAPPVQYMFNLGVDEIATDNVAESDTDRKADLSSLFSAGATVTADTARLNGVLAATGYYERNVVDTELDRYSEYAYANGQGVVIPGNLYVNVNGAIDDLSRTGGDVQNPLLQSVADTHTYTIGASPFLVSHFGDLGLNVLRYQIGQAWFSNNTGPIAAPGLNIGPISASTNQDAREDFKMAGTILARLMSDLSLSATEDDAGASASGDFKKANGELINEYEITRSASIIAGGGYEILRDQEVPVVDGQGPIWDVGARFRPDIDSSILLVYGHHDGKSDLAGEVEWRLTARTDVYAEYTDSLSSTQQTLISNDAGSVLGPMGAVTGITFDRSTLIGVLDDTALNAQPGNISAFAPNGIPLATSNDYVPLLNGLFRAKTLSASGRTLVNEDPVVLTAYHIQDISLEPFVVPSSASEGGTLSWSPGLSPNLSGLVVIGFSHLTGAEQADVYNAAVGATYLLSDSLSIVMRYDFIRHQADPSSGGYIQNAVTLGLHKSFN